MNSVSTVNSGFHAALRLALGRPDGVVRVADDRATIVRSFWSIAFCLPSVLCRLLMSWTDTGIPQDMVHLVGREIFIFLLGWLIFVEITYRFAPFIGRAQRWGRFIVIWNWCNLIEGVLVVIGGIPGILGAPPIVDQVSQLVMIGWALWLEWYGTRLALDASPLTAALLVLLDQSIGIILASIAVLIGS